ncbi:hypothetical protein HQ29_03145 [Porphyromonas canoris]|nr:hypothetical protein HQ29_03145 [Porphyromonas canoris]
MGRAKKGLKRRRQKVSSLFSYGVWKEQKGIEEEKQLLHLYFHTEEEQNKNQRESCGKFPSLFSCGVTKKQ